MREKTKGILKPKYYWIVSFALASLAMWVLFAMARVLSFEKYILLAGDSFEIYAADIRMFVRSILNGESIWYSFAVQMGMNTALSVAFKLFSPFNLLYLIFPNADINIVTAAIIILKTGTAAACFQLFCSKVLKNNSFTSVLFALFYAMNSYVVIYCVINFMWLDGVYMLPVVAMAVYCAVHENKYTLLTVSYAYIFIVQFYQGYMIGIFSLLYFVFLLVLKTKEERKVRLRESILRYAVSVVSAVCISAFVWVPVLLFLKNHYASDSTGFERIGISLIQVFGNFFWGKFQDYYWSVYLYCGIPCILLLPFYFTNGKIEKRERITYGVLLTFFLIGCVFLPLFALLHGFDAPDMWNYRFGFILSFLLCAVACRESEHLKEIQKKSFLLYVIGLAVFYLLEGKLDGLSRGESTSFILPGFWMNLCIVVLWTGLFLAGEHIKSLKKWAPALLIALAFVECVSNSLFAGAWNDSLIEDERFAQWEETNRSIMEKTAQEEGASNEFYRMYVLNDDMDNGDAYWGYNGISDFGTSENENLRVFLKNMGLYSMLRRTTVTGMTPSLEMLLANKYRVRLAGDYPEKADGNEPIQINLNEYCLPIGFMVNDSALDEMNLKDNVFENQNLVFGALCGIDDLYMEVPDEEIEVQENGMYLIGENSSVFYKSDSNPGEVILSVKDAQGSVYSQISYDGRTEVIVGVCVERTDNVGIPGECFGQIPFSAQWGKTGGEQSITYYSYGDMPVAFSADRIYVYELDDEALKKAYDNLDAEPLTVSEYKSGLVKGHVSVEGDRRVLFTSIPYIEGWSAYVNGQKAKLSKALNGTFIAIELPQTGEYDIELRYTCPGVKAGIAVSGFGLLLLVLGIVSERIKSGRENKSNV